MENSIQLADETFLIQRKRSKMYFIHESYTFVYEKSRGHRQYYHCADYKKKKCRVRLVAIKEPNTEDVYQKFQEHNHDPDPERGINNSHKIQMTWILLTIFFVFHLSDVQYNQVMHKGRIFYKHYAHYDKTYWRCTQIKASERCSARLCTHSTGVMEINEHNHD